MTSPNSVAGRPKLTFVVPCYNEAGTIDRLLDRVLTVPLPVDRDVVIVDDGSTDGTREKLSERWGPPEHPRDPRVRLFFQERNQGKGAAVRRGFAEATGDFLIIQDADLEYDPADIPLLLIPLLDGRADAVYGSRFLGGPHRVLLFWHYLGNRFLTFVTNVLYNVNLTDMETCYKVLKRPLAQSFRLTSNRFGIEPEITARLCQSRSRFYEVPISYSGRTYDEGKKITWCDGVAALWTLLRCRFW